MWFWWFMLACNLLTPAVMIIGGVLMWKRTPKKINGIYGYRTARSMKNLDTWQFAHRHCGRLWWIVGWAILPITVLVQLPFYKSGEGVVGFVSGIILALQMIALAGALFPTEAALKRTFDENGERRR